MMVIGDSRYASIRAIESPSKVDDEQWLAYWILYSFLTLVEMVAEPVLYWLVLHFPHFSIRVGRRNPSDFDRITLRINALCCLRP